MIEVENYKAFRGTMEINPKLLGREPFELTGDCLYKPDTMCWYAKGKSYPVEICKTLKDFSFEEKTQNA